MDLARRAALLALALLASAAAQPVAEAPAPAPAPAAPAAAPAGAPAPLPACPIAVKYSVNLGSGAPADFAAVPIFVASVELVNNDPEIAVEAWRLGFDFAAGEFVAARPDVFDNATRLVGAAPTRTPAFEAAPGARRLPTAGGAARFAFLGTKAPSPPGAAPDAANPYGVAPIEAVAFNNLLCARVAGDNARRAAAPGARRGAAAPGAPLLEVQYAPIEMAGVGLGPARATRLLARLANAQNASAVALPDASLQYWLAPPVAGAPTAFAQRPWDFVSARCEYITPPLACADVVVAISRGFADAPGGEYALNVTFAANAGAGAFLRPTGAGAPPAALLAGAGAAGGLDVVDVLLSIEAGPGGALDARLDYSFLDTPVAEGAAVGPGGVVPRRALPNERMPAYLKGALAWGALPAPGGAAGAPAAEGGAAGGDVLPAAAGALPSGVACETARSGGAQACSLVAVYCCASPDPAAPPMATTVPAVWPPRSAAVAPGADPGAEPLQPPRPPPAPLPSELTGSPAPPVVAPPTQEQQPQAQPPKSGGGSLAWIAGAAIGLVAGLLAAGSALAVALRRRRRRLAGEKTAGAGGAAAAWPDGGEEAGGAGGCALGKDGRPAGLPFVSTWPRAAAAAGAPAAARERRGSAAAASPGSAAPLLAGAARSSALQPFRADGTPRSRSSVGGSSPPLAGAPLAAALIKFPSGISSFSGASGGSAAGVLDSGLDSGGRTATLAGLAAGGAGRRPARPGRPTPDNVLRLLESRARTAPAAAAGAPAELPASPARSDASGSDAAAPPAAWQLRRSASWNGVLKGGAAAAAGDAGSAGSWGAAARELRARRRDRPVAGPSGLRLPPLPALPPPLAPPGAGPATGVDLDVEWGEVAAGLGPRLGAGGFGTVFAAAWRGRRVAVKVLPAELAGGGGPAEAAARAALLREIRLASRFASARLVRVLGACTREPGRCALIMDLAEGGSLFGRAHDRARPRLTYAEVLQVRVCRICASLLPRRPASCFVHLQFPSIYSPYSPIFALSTRPFYPRAARARHRRGPGLPPPHGRPPRPEAAERAPRRRRARARRRLWDLTRQGPRALVPLARDRRARDADVHGAGAAQREPRRREGAWEGSAAVSPKSLRLKFAVPTYLF
jgi:hypothetical protein